MIGKSTAHDSVTEKLRAGEMADMYRAKVNGPELTYELAQSLGAGHAARHPRRTDPARYGLSRTLGV